MKSVLSIQSHVAFGYAGNRAAVFPLQRLGFEVSFINTVQFSNHSGYGSFQGDIFSAEQLRKLINGMRERGVLSTFNAVLSGYMGDPDLGAFILEVVAELKTLNADLIYCCDPVIGDIGRGVFVRPGVGEYFRDHVVPMANILTPNLFELSYLTNIDIHTQDDLRQACQILHERGPEMILVTSVILNNTKSDRIQMLLSTRDNAWMVETPRFEMLPPPGAGDMTAALFLGHILNKESPDMALAKTAASVYGIFEKTFQVGSRELQMIAGQEEIVAPRYQFPISFL